MKYIKLCLLAALLGCTSSTFATPPSDDANQQTLARRSLEHAMYTRQLHDTVEACYGKYGTCDLATLDKVRTIIAQAKTVCPELPPFVIFQSYNGQDALQIAVEHGDIDLAELLLEAGADAHYGSVLTTAVGKQNPSMVALLLRHGAKADVCLAPYDNECMKTILIDGGEEYLDLKHEAKERVRKATAILNLLEEAIAKERS